MVLIAKKITMFGHLFCSHISLSTFCNNNLLFIDKCGPTCSQAESEVCGTNQKTYRNECHLKRESCKTGKHVRKQYDGKCSKS